MTSREFDALFGGPPRAPEVAAHAARDGPGRVDPGGHRRDHAALRAPRARGDRHEEPVPGRRRRAQLRRQRPDPARRPVRATSGSSRPPAMPAARSASRCSSGTSCSTTPRTRRAARLPARLAARARASTTTRSAHASTRAGADYRDFDDEDDVVRRTSPTLLAERESRRLVPGADGVRPARARRSQHPRRRAQRRRCSR